MTQTPLIIVGDSAFAQIAREYFEVDTGFSVVAFAVERAFQTRDSLDGLPVVALESLPDRFDPATHHVHVAITYIQLNRVRARLVQAVKTQGYSLASYVSPRAFVWRNVEMGEHCFVFEHNTLQPFVRLGSNVVLWSGNHVGHHTIVRDNCFVSSHVVISGFCDIGENSFLGVNAAVANNVVVGRDNWLGPGTSIMKDTPAGALFRTEHPEPSRVSAPRFFRIDS
jgi:sugar O-acyltransferase (sialic acid O-acetyltransferase NeuD family)